jgi:N-methylhydantoinase A
MIRAAFETAYGKAFSRLLPGVPIRIVTLKVAAIGRRPAFDLKALAPTSVGSTETARRGTRAVWFHGGLTETSIWARLELPVGSVVSGPAILEQPDSTIVVEPGLIATTDAFGNLIITRG